MKIIPSAFFLSAGLSSALLCQAAETATIPEFQAIGTSVGKLLSAALTGQMPVEQALASAQQTTEREMKRAGYPK
ncbi:hypothetical protein TU81_02780 [Pseudomonas lini]|nr:hypothetical protein TU81_02780 [Pseudomonas lini]